MKSLSQSCHSPLNTFQPHLNLPCLTLASKSLIALRISSGLTFQPHLNLSCLTLASKSLIALHVCSGLTFQPHLNLSCLTLASKSLIALHISSGLSRGKLQSKQDKSGRKTKVLTRN